MTSTTAPSSDQVIDHCRIFRCGSHARNLSWMRQSSLVVVANRLPLDDSAAPDGACEWRRSPGGLASALHAILQQTPATWVGWAGGVDRAPALPDIGSLRIRPVRAVRAPSCAATTRASPTPRCGRSTTTPSSSRSSTAAGGRPTRRSTGASPRPPPRWPSPAPRSGCRTTTCSWCPQLLRELRPDLLIGFFLHVPFPPPELFMQLPRRVELLRGMLGADLVGFQRAAGRAQRRPARRQAARRRRPPTTRSRWTAGWCAPARSRSRSTSPRCEALAARPDVVEPRRSSCAPTWASRARVLLSVDRLDYTKGIEHRLTAYSELLRDGRVKVRDTVMVQVAVPSRERVEQLPGAAGPDRGRGRPDQRRVRPGRRTGHPLPQPAVRPGRPGRALPDRRRHGGDPAARRDEPGRQGVRGRPRATAAARWCSASSPGRPPSWRTRSWSTRTTWTGSRRPCCTRWSADPADLRAPDGGDARAPARARHPGLGPRLPDRPGPHRPAGGLAAAAAAGLSPPAPWPASRGSRRSVRASRRRASGRGPCRGTAAARRRTGAAVRSSADRGTTRSSGLPTTSTGGSPTGASGGAAAAAATGRAAEARPSRPAYAWASLAGRSRLNSCRRLSRSRPPNTRRQRAERVARSAAPSVAQPSSTGATSTRGPGRIAGQRVRHDQRAGAVPDQHGLARQARGHLHHVVGVRPQRLGPARCAVAARLTACAGKPRAGGVLQPVLGERPGAVARARARTAPAACPRRRSGVGAEHLPRRPAAPGGSSPRTA